MPTTEPPAMVRRVLYGLVSAVIHQPVLMRWLGSAIRGSTLLETTLPVAVRDTAARHVFRRPASFSNTSHAPNLVAGEFVIGLESGPLHTAERAYASAKLPPAAACGQAAQAEALRRLAELGTQKPLRFDIVDDYLVSVVWAGMRPIFGGAAPALEQGATPDHLRENPGAAMQAFFREMRYPGAHLIIGGLAGTAVRKRAVRSARALRARVWASLPAIAAAWGVPADGQARRNAVGLLWVGHPATVQAGALVMQVLLERPEVHDTLRGQAVALGAGAWHHPEFRENVRRHVVEALRFRPPFPMLIRDVPRDTEYTLDDTRRVSTRAGGKVVLMALAAMFDPATGSPGAGVCPFGPGRAPGAAGPHHLIFGHGPRACIAQDQVVQILTSALIGLLTLPPLTWGSGWWRRIVYDGPIISRMRLRAR